MKFKKDYLVGELELPYSALEDKILGKSRWSLLHAIIFELDGKFYRTSYSTGATEGQDESPWEYEEEINCIEVMKRDVMTTQWVNV